MLFKFSFLSHFFSFFLRGEKKRNETERKEKTRSVTSGFHPETQDLFDELAYQIKGHSAREQPELAPAGKRVASLLWLLSSLSVDIKEKKVTRKRGNGEIKQTQP